MVKIKVDNPETFEAKLREFFEKAPLYQEYAFVDASGKGVSYNIYCNIPASLSLKCDVCKKETTWEYIKGYPDNSPPSPPPEACVFAKRNDYDYYYAKFRCALCGESIRLFFYTGSDQYSIQKIGQYPPLSIDLPHRLENTLGRDDAELYKKALTCRNFSYGLGALVYIRRVIENKTDLILTFLIKLAETEEDQRRVKELEKIKSGKQADNKLKESAEYLPASLCPSNQNPLSLLYKCYSIGIHSLTEEQCLQIFDETRMNFEYILVNIEQQLTSAKSYIDNLQKIKKKINNV